MIRLEEITKHLLILNILIFFSVKYLLNFLHLEPYFTLISPGVEYDFGGASGVHGFKPIQLLTYMFMHGDERHLLFNMLGLYFFGSSVELLLGPKRFVLLYLLAGIVSGVVQIYLTGGSVVGASGAINGVLVAFATMLPNVEMMFMFIPVPIKSKYVAIFMIVYGIYAGMNGIEAGIGHYAHVAGAIVGFLLIQFWGLAKLR